jgi:hypothetical protein
VRLTFNIWPNSKLEATKCVVPFAALYTPNKRLPNMPVRSCVQLAVLLLSVQHAARHQQQCIGTVLHRAAVAVSWAASAAKKGTSERRGCRVWGHSISSRSVLPYAMRKCCQKLQAAAARR